MNDKTILIVEDDKNLLLALCVRLMSRGYATLCATDAASAIEIVAKKEPDLILLGSGLAASNGFIIMAMTSQLSSAAAIPVILVGPRPLGACKEASRLIDAKGYFQVPADNEDLLTAIQREFGESPACGADEFAYLN